MRHMRASTFALHDRLIGGDLRERLKAYRDEGFSYDEIAFRLRDEGVVISRSTVHRWCQDLGIETS